MLIETLERRQLLSASAYELPCGILVVQADNNGDSVRIAETANGVDLSGNPARRTVQVFQDTVDDTLPVGAGLFTNVNKIVVLGGNGADTITVDTQDVGSYIDGGNGNDTITVNVNPDEFVFDSSSGSVSSVFHPEFTGGCNTIYGGNGNDNIATTGVRDTQISGGNGNDQIIVRAVKSVSDDHPGTLVGGENILVNGDNGDDFIGADSVSCSIVSGDNGTDMIQVSNSSYTLILGGNGSDNIRDDVGGTNVIDGGNGHDVIVATVGDRVLHMQGDAVSFS